VSNYNQRTFDIVVSKNHDHSPQLSSLSAPPTEELQRYCRLPGHADGLSGRFLVAEGLDHIGEPLRRNGWQRWSATKAYTDASGTRWRHQIAASISSSEAWRAGLMSLAVCPLPLIRTRVWMAGVASCLWCAGGG
jgi:hypothetical protein